MAKSDRYTISRAMSDPDNLVIRMLYSDSKGNLTRRVVSPMTWQKNRTLFRALCLSREECRQFTLARCSQIDLCNANLFVMPIPIETIE